MSYDQCTWAKCTEMATVPQIGKDGIQWANLCTAHAVKLDNVIATLDPAKMIGVWILAQGGSRKAAERM